jgi:hypothetical protein
MACDENQRRYFRVHYPVGMRPVLDLGGERFDVTELSEGGLRVLREGTSLSIGHPVAGTLRLRCGEELRVTGQVGRLAGDECVVLGLTGVGFGSVMREQQHLVATCPDYGRRPEAD